MDIVRSSEMDGDCKYFEMFQGHTLKSILCGLVCLCVCVCSPLNHLKCPVGLSVKGWERHQAGEFNWSVEGFSLRMEGEGATTERK